MDIIENAMKMKRTLEDLQRQIHRSEGSMTQLQSQLKSEFDVSTIEEANKLLKKMGKEQTKMESEVQEKQKEWEDKWLDKLRG